MDQNGNNDNESSDLNIFVQLNDIIEYRSSKKDIPKKGQIVSIGALSSDKILQVSDGTWLFKKIHQVKRIEISRDSEDKRMINPSPKWRGLDKMVVIPPYETVDDDDSDGVGENENNDDRSGKKRRRIMKSQVITSQDLHLVISKIDHCTVLQNRHFLTTKNTTTQLSVCIW